VYAEPDLIVAWDRESKGVPIGRAAEVNLRNNHTQYIFTWWVSFISHNYIHTHYLRRYALAAATSVMLWMVVRKPPADVARRVRQSKEW
jgi:surfeit locus 1 family protein